MKKNRVSFLSVIKKYKRQIIVLGIQFLTTLVLLSYIQILNLLPLSIYILLALVCFVLFLMMLLMQVIKNKKVFRTGIIISIVISILMSTGSYFAYKTSNLLNSISNTGGRHTTLSVITRNDVNADSLSDVSGQLFYPMMSEQLVQANIDHFTKGHNIELATAENYLSMANELLSYEKDFIIIDEAQRGFVEENIEIFSTDTKVIDKLKVALPDEDLAKNVDVSIQPISIYISGIDTYGDPGVSSRTDSNMILTYHPKTGKILLTSIPRDYYLPLSCAGGAYDKFTHSGLYGIDCSVQTLENLFEIDINYYVRVNFTGFLNIIDALGGIQVYSPVAFSTSGGRQRYSFVAGMNNLNSAQALAFSRERYSLPGGDNARVLNQQLVVTAILQKLASPAIVQNFSGFAMAIQGSVVTNMPSDQISTLIRDQVSGGMTPTIDSVAVTGYGSNTTTYSIPHMEQYVMVPDQASVNEAISRIHAILNGE